MSLSNKLAVPQALAAKDPWAAARQRVRTYLTLQRIPELTCEQILHQAVQQVPAKPPKAEAEQIQLLLQAAQKVTQAVMGCSYAEQSAQPSNSRSANWTARKTGPRVERSSIKVAPLQAISLRLTPPRQTAGRA